jgi:hypothetical protein
MCRIGAKDAGRMCRIEFLVQDKNFLTTLTLRNLMNFFNYPANPAAVSAILLILSVLFFFRRLF